MIEGALVFHLVIAPFGATREELEADLERYVTTLVDKVLRAVNTGCALEPDAVAGTGTICWLHWQNCRRVQSCLLLYSDVGSALTFSTGMTLATLRRIVSRPVGPGEHCTVTTAV